MVVVWGWVCALAGSVVSVPQVVRLLRAGTSEGVSLLMWQLLLGVGIGWTSHGLLVGHANLVVPNVVSSILSILVLVMLQRDRRLSTARVWPLGLAVGAACIAVEVLGSAAWFGIVAVVPVAVGMFGQTRNLIRSPDISGISGAYLLGAFGLQGMWLSWAALAGDISTLICSSVVGVICGLNAALWLLRTRRTVVIGVPTAQDMAA
ncbi:hypothetical protein G7070_07240 [Propioniciclava coleopterorum]|uniref:PQ loop repeat protein n=1 Tax=Propioniciclava coleopterorum TaxID=2714937 RepID=A0A6G7Y5K2_9ACTN|nr:hypothetical protein [Propioniciclava coleopterorum]QIK72102.1 hypothetical protein G7070_07240 [Propioniciclava coleopterorum]